MDPTAIGTELISAAARNSLTEVKKLLSSLDDVTLLEDAINFEFGVLHVSPLQVAAFKGNVEMVELLLQNGSNVKAADKLGRSALHYAAANDSANLVRLLISYGANVDVRFQSTWQQDSSNVFGCRLPVPAVRGRTPLHLAATRLHFECAKILLDGGADVNIKDGQGFTPILIAGEEYNLQATSMTKEYERFVELLMSKNAQIDITDESTKKGVFHQAIKFDSLNTCVQLLENGLDPNKLDNDGDSILHAACKHGRTELVHQLMSYCNHIVNLQNKKGETALHYAAFAGNQTCLSVLLDHGGDMSSPTHTGVTVADVIMAFVPRPVDFFTEKFDSKLIPNDRSINDRSFNVTLDFHLLAPTSDRQMSVIIAMIKAMTTQHKYQIILHPLIETFIRLKWIRLRIFFFVLVVVHFSFVMSLSLYAFSLFGNSTDKILEVSRLFMVVSASLLFLHVVAQTSLAPNYFLKEYETWLTASCVALSLSMGAIKREALSEDVMLPDWIRHLAAYDVLLSWTQLMFILGRFPSIGYFALMFYRVLKNVSKVLLFFACLVIGFSLSFCIQFNNEEFSDPWKAFVRTTVMLMGEFEYGDLFNEKLPPRFIGVPGKLFVTSRLIFLFFIFLGSIVLMNLMTGLAVNDIQGLKSEGNVRHMIKQVEFMTHVEKLFTRKKLPSKLRKFFNNKMAAPESLSLHPNAVGRICKIEYRTKTQNMPSKLLERIMLTAVKNQKDEGELSQDAKLDNTLAEIKAQLQDISLRLSGAKQIKEDTSFECSLPPF